MKLATSALRRAKRRLRPAKTRKSAGSLPGSLQGAMAGLMVAAAMAPLTALGPKPARRGPSLATRAGQSLGVVLGQLRDAQALLPGARSSTPDRPVRPPRLAKGARWLSRTHKSAAGARAYRLYIPATAPKGLIVMLHGCNQTPEDFALGTRMNALGERHGLAIAWPAQSLRRNPAGCWNWFQPGDQGRGAGEPAILAALTRRLMREFGLGREAVFVAGLSAGGAMAAILATVYPDLYAAAGVHSGMAHGSARNVMTAMTVMRNGTAVETGPADPLRRARPVRWIVFQGGADSTVHPSNADRIVAAAAGPAAEPARTQSRSAGGRDYARNDYAGAGGSTLVESWLIGSAGHAWSGGLASGSFSDAGGPDASSHMVRFFLAKAG
jgi:poly(hydroxyalkanoate) depolymerase family esterase